MGGAKGSVARIVAFPLESEGQLLGTLVAGIPVDEVSLATLDRLALRAALAASALRERSRNAEEAKLAARQQALLDCIAEPLLLLDDAGKITSASRGAMELTGLVSKTGGPEAAGLPPLAYFPELFCQRDWERLETWLQAWFNRSGKSASLATSLFERNCAMVWACGCPWWPARKLKLRWFCLNQLSTSHHRGMPAVPKSNCKTSSYGSKKE